MNKTVEKIEKLLISIVGEWGGLRYDLYAQAIYDQIVKPLEEEIKKIIDEIGIDLLEDCFPKGQCKERGKAIVLYARLQLELDQALKGEDNGTNKT